MDWRRDPGLVSWLLLFITVLRVGCDGVVGSGARPDSCGVCAGDNSTCRIVAGIFTRPQLAQGYNMVALLPRGACNVTVSQMRPTRNLLNLRSVGGTLVLTGGRGGSRVYEVAGTRFTYAQADHLRGESLSAPGPLSEPLELMLMYQQPNPGVKYEYALPVLKRELSAAGAPPTALAPPLSPPTISTGGDRGDTGDNEVLEGHFPFGQDVQGTDPDHQPDEGRGRKGRRYVWRVTGVSDCSKTCGGGSQQAVIQCVRENSLLPVSEKRCQGQEKPASYSVRCGTRPCPAQWVTGEWSGCSVTCGSGTQSREQSCRQEISSTLSVRVADGACLGPRPEVTRMQACRMPPCPGHHHHHHHHHHVARPPPPPGRDLQAGSAPGTAPGTAPAVAPPPAQSWVVGPWSQCECGKGLRSRSVSCPAGASCTLDRPPAQEACEPSPGACKNHFWLASEWSTHCSAECGTGVQSRSVVCSAGPRPTAEPRSEAAWCEAGARPPHTRACSSETSSCRGGQWFTSSWGPCSATCGQGVQTRGVACVQWRDGRFHVHDEEWCEARARPDTQQPCAERACPPHWYASEWSECSRSCGTGAQKREVRCVGPAGPSTACLEDDKLPARKSCHLQDCQATRSVDPETQDEPADSAVTCEDRLRNCHLVVQARLCKYSYYGTSCCSSCRRKGE